MTVDKLIGDMLQKHAGITPAEAVAIEHWSNRVDPNAAASGKIHLSAQDEDALRGFILDIMKLPKSHLMALLNDCQRRERESSVVN